jgi:DNA repair exonuclease SbcCD ATPase subunit
MIEEILGMDFLTFTNSIMFGQGLIKLFASATDAEQKKILEQMLQIDVFRSAQELAKDRVAELNVLIQDIQSTVDKNKALHKSWDEKVQDLQAKEAELEDKVSKRILDLESDLTSYKGQLEDLESEESLIRELETYKILLDKSLVKLDAYKADEESRSEILSLIKSNDLEVSKLNKKISKNEDELDGIRSGKNVPKKCEACGQTLPLDDTSHVENHLEQAIKDLRGEVADLNNDSKDLKSLLSKVDKKLEGKKQLELDIGDLKESVSDINRDINDLEKNRNSIQDSIALTEKLIDEQKELMKTTYSDMIEKTIFDIEQILDVIRADEEVINTHMSKKDKYAFWVEAYGNQGIKSVLLDSVTPFLNERANKYLSKLSGSSIGVTFSTQQEIMSGKNKGQKKDKFAVEVNNQNGDLNYEGNSGGEKRRVDVAINMALQDLVFNRSNKHLDLIVYDEVFEGLDAVGCENVIYLLKEKAKQCGTVLVITHSDYLKQLFTKSMKMVKSNGQTIIKEDVV